MFCDYIWSCQTVQLEISLAAWELLMELNLLQRGFEQVSSKLSKADLVL